MPRNPILSGITTQHLEAGVLARHPRLLKEAQNKYISLANRLASGRMTEDELAEEVYRLNQKVYGVLNRTMDLPTTGIGEEEIRKSAEETAERFLENFKAGELKDSVTTGRVVKEMVKDSLRKLFKRKGNPRKKYYQDSDAPELEKSEKLEYYEQSGFVPVTDKSTLKVKHSASVMADQDLKAAWEIIPKRLKRYFAFYRRTKDDGIYWAVKIANVRKGDKKSKSNPEKTKNRNIYGVEILNDDPLIGVYGDKVYWLVNLKDSLSGFQLKVVGLRDDIPVLYSRTKGFNWDRIMKFNMGAGVVFEIRQHGQTYTFVPEETNSLYIEKTETLKKVSKIPVYRGYLYKRLPTPFGMMYLAAETEDGLNYDDAFERAKTKERLFYLLDMQPEGSATGDKSKRNPSSPDFDAARRTSEMFHGRPMKEMIEQPDSIFIHDNLAKLGDMVSIKLTTVFGDKAEITFDPKKPASCPALCADPECRQLYIEGGDQRIGLDSLGFSGAMANKDKVLLGDIVEITYRSDKAFDNFETIDYFHKLGEESGVKPSLVYDTHNKYLLIVGGDYTIEDRGIVN